MLELDIDGIFVKLQIKNYKQTNEENWDSEWCKCDFSFSSGGVFNYHKENDEVLLSSEIDNLIEQFTKLLDNKILDKTEIVCIEPDFVFNLYPQKDLREDYKYTYIKPGYEIKDIYLEWRFYFWNEGLTNNYLTVTLDRDEILKFRDYLLEMIAS